MQSSSSTPARRRSSSRSFALDGDVAGAGAARADRGPLHRRRSFVAKDAGRRDDRRPATWDGEGRSVTTARSRFLLDFLRGELARHRLRAVGPSRRARRHRVRPPGARRRDAWSRTSSASFRSRRCTSRTTSPRSARCSRARRSCRRSPASTPSFHRTACRRSRRPSRCRRRSPTAACAATASTGCPTSTSPRRCRSSTPPRRDGRVVVAHLGNGASMCAMRRRPQRRHDDGLHRRRRPADGHALRRARSRRPALPDGRAQDGRARDREAALPGVGPARRVRRVAATCATLLASDDPRARVRGRALLLPRSSANWARSPPRWAASTRWCSPAASASTRRRCASASLRAAAWLGIEARRRRQRDPRAAAHEAGQPHPRVGDSHQRGADDRAAHARADRRLTRCGAAASSRRIRPDARDGDGAPDPCASGSGGGQLLLGERHPVARADRQHVVVEVVVRVVQARACRRRARRPATRSSRASPAA